MISKQQTFENLILFSLISFGLFGSLSHLFNSLIISLLILHFLVHREDLNVRANAKLLYGTISLLFFIFLIRSFFHHDAQASIMSISPMLPIPIIALMILLAGGDIFRISTKKLALFAKIAVLTSYATYYILSTWIAEQFGLHKYISGRLELFSGNPIPFSTVIFGITIFTLIEWRIENWKKRIFTLSCCLLGFYLAGELSGTRGTMLAIIISAPILLWYVFQSIWISISITLAILSISYFLNEFDFFYGHRINRFSSGLEKLLTGDSSDRSIMLRLEMWEAAIRSFADIPLFGYDISNRFAALKPHLRENFSQSFTHPHNDIFASIIGIGFFGLFLSIISLLSAVWAALLSDDNKEGRLVIAILVAIGLLCTANVNTVFFNDITAAWLSFSTFLIWNMKYSDHLKDVRKTK